MLQPKPDSHLSDIVRAKVFAVSSLLPTAPSMTVPLMGSPGYGINFQPVGLCVMPLSSISNCSGKTKLRVAISCLHGSKSIGRSSPRFQPCFLRRQQAERRPVELRIAACDSGDESMRTTLTEGIGTPADSASLSASR